MFLYLGDTDGITVRTSGAPGYVSVGDGHLDMMLSAGVVRVLLERLPASLAAAEEMAAAEVKRLPTAVPDPDPDATDGG